MGASRTGNYLKGLASGYVVTLATIFVGLWLTPFTLHYLNREAFAVFTLAGDMLMWLGLLEIGLSAVLNVQAAQNSGKPDQRQLDTLASTTFFAQVFIALGVLSLGCVLGFGFPSFFSVRPELARDAVRLMGLLSLGAALNVGTQTFSALLVAHQQIHVDNVLRLLLLGLRTVLTVALLTSNVGLLSLGYANLAATAITSALAAYRVRRLLPGLTIRWRNFSWEVLRRTGGLGIWFSLGGLAGILITNLDRIVTAKVVSVEMVTTLALTGRIYVLANAVIQQITNTARPALAQIIGQGRMDHAREKYHQLVSLSSGLAIIAAGSLWAGNEAFVVWWVGARNYGGVWLDAFLALNLVVHSWVLPNRAILTAGLSNVPKSSGIRFVEGLANLVLSVVMGLRWGAVGVVAATAVAGVLTSCWYLPWVTARQFDVTLGQLWRKDLPGLLGAAAATVGAAALARQAWASSEGMAGALLRSGFAGALCTVAFVVFFVNRSIRNSAFEYLGGLPWARWFRASGGLV